MANEKFTELKNNLQTNNLDKNFVDEILQYCVNNLSLHIQANEESYEIVQLARTHNDHEKEFICLIAAKLVDDDSDQSQDQEEDKGPVYNHYLVKLTYPKNKELEQSVASYLMRRL